MSVRIVLDRVTGVSSSGAGFFAHQSEDCWGGRRWGHVDCVLVQKEKFGLVEVSVLFLGLSSLFRELRVGCHFWLCSLLGRYIWVSTI